MDDLGYATSAMVKLTPEQQHEFVERAPDVFSPATGAWGRSGSTKVLLSVAQITIVRKAVLMAAKNIAAARRRPAGFNP